MPASQDVARTITEIEAIFIDTSYHQVHMSPPADTMTSLTAIASSMTFSNDLKDLGITYWQKLVREGAPQDEARVIAGAIARFKLFKKAPTPEQKQLIAQFSRFICRAQLWHSDLLL